jgi:hypothetical protein
MNAEHPSDLGIVHKVLDRHGSTDGTFLSSKHSFCL